MKKILSSFVLLLALVFLGACAPASEKKSATEAPAVSKMPQIDGITYHGDVPQNPKKLVNFTYSFTGYLLQLGIQPASYSLDLEKNSPVFGSQLKDAVNLTSSDIEAIAAQEPDLIMVFSGDQNLEKLKEIAPVIEVTYGKRDYLQMMSDLGAIFSKEKEAQEWLTNWDKKVAAAKEELSSVIDPATTTFTVMDFYDKNIYIYGDNFGRGGELIYDSLGFAAPAKVKEDVIDKDGWFGISQEALSDYVGDYALVNVNEKTKEAAASLKESDVWKNLPAVQAGHAIEVDYNLFYFSDPMSLDKQLSTFVEIMKDMQP